MNASFGIDHPLLATHDIHTLREYLIALGFNMTAVGKHPWGTSTSLAMFDGCLLEIMGLYDSTLIDEVPAGEFRFGRHVFEHLQLREGIALTALHSLNSEQDAEHAEDQGFHIAGQLEFGRDVTLPDGSTGRTKTTLALMPDKTFPRLSFFLCQQHRPELIYVPQWLKHPNTVHGICGVNAVAKAVHHEQLQQRFSKLYGTHQLLDGGFQFQTANGVLRFFEPDAFASTVGAVPEKILHEALPCIAGMDFLTEDVGEFRKYLETSGMAYRELAAGFALTNPEVTANTVFRFF